MRAAWMNVARVSRVLWVLLRDWCGDTAYERYRRAIVKKDGTCLLTAQQFYVQQLERKYSRPNRCC